MNKKLIVSLLLGLSIAALVVIGLNNYSNRLEAKKSTQEYKDYYTKCLDKMVLTENQCMHNALAVVEDK